jgi:hypothetical protein
VPVALHQTPPNASEVCAAIGRGDHLRAVATGAAAAGDDGGRGSELRVLYPNLERRFASYEVEEDKEMKIQRDLKQACVVVCAAVRWLLQIMCPCTHAGQHARRGSE